MELRYMGFEQRQNIRAYAFDRIAEREPIVHFVVSVDVALFFRNHVGIQEGPKLCALKLAADLGALQEGSHELTNDDMLAFTNARAAGEARKAESRRVGSKRRNRPVPGVVSAGSSGFGSS